MTTKTTLHLSLTMRDRLRTWLAQRDPIMLMAILAFCLIIGLALARRLVLAGPAQAVAQPTPPLPIILIASPLPNGPMPTAVPPIQVAAQLPQAPRYIVAFAAPDGVALGAIPEPAASAITGRYGDGWISTTWQGNTVWLRSAELGANLANLAPVLAPQPQTVYVSAPAAPAAAESEYQTSSAPPPPQAPEQSAQPAAAPVVAPVPAQQQPLIYPTLAPMEQNDVTREWARQQWLSEHPEAAR